jgi:predicted nuclease of predicted toxin-antitoxin system
MKLLFDQGTPIPLRKHLPHHIVETAYEKGWGNLKNGDLITLAEAEGFDVLITTDQNLRYQQNLSGRRIGVIVLMTTSWPRIKKNAVLVVQAIDNLHPGSYEEIDFP